MSDNNNNADDESNLLQLFKIKTEIVGKRHYSGHINDGEMVHLVRQPQNPYGILLYRF